jgi:hypothetical protein
LGGRKGTQKVKETLLATPEKTGTGKENKMQVAKFYLNDADCERDHLILDHLNLEDFEPLESFEVGDILTVKIEEMDKKDFEELPEFDGW